MILAGAEIALQLSHREGFEVKVTEALHKGCPVIAYKAGGIPLQIRDGKDGYLVPVGEIDTVVDHLYDLLTDSAREKMSEAGQNGVPEDYFTVSNTINWLYLITELAEGRSVGGGVLVRSLWHDKEQQQQQ